MGGIKQLVLSSKEFVFDFFTKGHERTILAKKNIVASFGLKVISVAVNLALVPLTINYVNPTQYGIWLTLSSIIAWFSFFDIGFGQGLRNRFAEAKAKGNFENARIYVSTTYAVLTIIFLSVWILFFAVNFFVDWSNILNAPTEMAAELSTLALIIFSFFCIQFILKTINIVVIADQKPALSAFLDTLGQLLALIIIYILTKTTEGSLINLGITLGFVPLLILLFSSIILFSTKYKPYSPKIKYIRFDHTKDIMSLGIKFFIIQIGVIVIFQTTNIIITQILGPDSVTTYNIVHKYFFVIGMVFFIVLSPFWTAFTEAYTLKDFDWMKSTIKKLEKLWFMLLSIIIIMFLFSDFILRIWIGDVVKVPLAVSATMALNIIFYTRYNIYMLLINGIGKVRLQLIIIISICICYVPVAIYLIKSFDLPGLILTNVFINIIFSIFSQIQISKILDKKAYGIWNK